MSALYEKDFHAWCLEQSELLKSGSVENLDMENLAEEMECLGRAERKELRSRLKVLFAHLLKLKFQPDYIGKQGWLGTISEQRSCIHTLIDFSPSLKYCQEEVAINAYEKAVDDAEKEMGKQIPEFYRNINTVFTLKEALDFSWLPE